MIFLNLRGKVVEMGLCTSCGTCVGICPVSCIRMDDNGEPQLFDECTDCGLCLKFCPSANFDFGSFHLWNENVETNPFVGAYQSIYFGRTVDQEIQNKASGGGIVSTLLISALEKRLIDGAIVVKMDEEDIARTKVVIAKNRDEVLEAAQSKYIPAPINTVLKQVKSKKGKFALVGLPCHIHAIRKLQADGPKWYSDKIKYLIGLFCGSKWHNNSMDYIFSVFNLKKKDVKEIYFRYRRHPVVSSLLIATKDGRRFFVDKKDYAFMFYLFAQEACLYCIDHTNEFADISVGDMRPFPAESSNYKVIEPLQSVIMVRTEEGAKLFKNADDKINFFSYDIQDLIASKLTNMMDRKICSHVRIHLRNRIGLPTPEFNQNLMEDYYLPDYGFKICPSRAFTASRYFYELSWIVIVNLMKRKVATSLISKIPIRVLRTIMGRGYVRYKTRGLLRRIK